jgi:hypothetical protein
MTDDMDTEWLRDAALPENGPPDDIYRLAVPIWCRQSHQELAEHFGPEYGCGFADGFRQGIVMAIHRPEWAHGLYCSLREYYLTTHTEEDLTSWELCAHETVSAMPLRSRLDATARFNQLRDADEWSAIEDFDEFPTKPQRPWPEHTSGLSKRDPEPDTTPRNPQSTARDQS